MMVASSEPRRRPAFSWARHSCRLRRLFSRPIRSFSFRRQSSLRVFGAQSVLRASGGQSIVGTLDVCGGGRDSDDDVIGPAAETGLILLARGPCYARQPTVQPAPTHSQTTKRQDRNTCSSHLLGCYCHPDHSWQLVRFIRQANLG